jgi:hypothetical protein
MALTHKATLQVRSSDRQCPRNHPPPPATILSCRVKSKKTWPDRHIPVIATSSNHPTTNTLYTNMMFFRRLFYIVALLVVSFDKAEAQGGLSSLIALIQSLIESPLFATFACPLIGQFVSLPQCDDGEDDDGTDDGGPSGPSPPTPTKTPPASAPTKKGKVDVVAVAAPVAVPTPVAAPAL